MMFDQYESAERLGALYQAVDQALKETYQRPHFAVPVPDPIPEEEDDMTAIPDVPGLTLRPLRPHPAGG